MKAIVVGSNGYLGQNLSLFLLDKGVQLLGTDIHQQSLVSHRFIEYRELDITNKENVNSFSWECDVLYILAGSTGTKASIENADIYTETNQIGLINILMALVKQNIKCRVVFPSTRLVYRGSIMPLTEESTKEFKTIYAVNKYACEKSLEIFSKYYGIEYTIFRICVLYGNLGTNVTSYGTIEFMIHQAMKGAITLYGDGNQKRTFVHMGDVVSLLYTGATSEKLKNDVFNIGGETFSLREVAEMIAEKDGIEIFYKPWPAQDLVLETGDTIFDSNKLGSILSYQYQYKFSDFINARVS